MTKHGHHMRASAVRGEPVLSCLRLGGACGALSTLGLGGTARQPSLEEALAFLAGSSG